MSRVQSLELDRDSTWRTIWSAKGTPYSFAVITTVTAFAARVALSAYFGPPYILFYPAVMLSAVLGGLGPGLVATALSSFLAARWVIPSLLQSRPMGTRDVVSLGAFAAMGVFMSAVAALYRRARDEIAQQERETALRDARERSRRLEEETLRASEQRLRLFVEHTPAAVAMFDRQMRYLVASPRFVSDYHVKQRDLIGRSYYEVFPEIPERWREIHRRCLAGAVERCDEDPFPRADGTMDWVRWEILPWRDAAGEIGGIILFSEVVTERKRAEQKLAAERERLAVTLESIGDAVIATDEAATITVFNGVAAELTGWNAADAMGKPLHEVFRILNEDTREPVPSPVERVLRDEVVVGLAHHISLVARDGSERPIADSGAPIRDADGNVTGVVLVFRDQTEERRAEIALRESEARYRVILEQAPVGIARVESSTGRFLQVNDRLCEMLGHSRQAVLSRTWRDVTHPDDLPANVDGVGRMQAAGKPYRTEKRYVREDGSTFWAHLTVSPVLVPGEAPSTQVAIVEDVTDRKRAEDQFARVAASVPGVVHSFRLRRDGTACMPFTTPAVVDLLGIPSDVLARDVAPWAANVHPADRQRVTAAIDEAARRLAPWHDVYRYLHPAKGERWIEGWSLPDREPDGSVVWHGYMTDVTEQQHADAALRESEVRFRAIFEQVAVGMAQVDVATGHFVRVNDKLCRIVGYARDELLTMRWQDLTHPDEVEGDLEAYQRFVEGQRSYTREKRYVRKDGSHVWIELTVAPMWSRGERPTSHVSVVKDITVRRQAQEALVRSEERLRALIEKASDMVLVLDGDGRYQFWSQSAVELLGWTPQEKLGRRALEMVHEDDRHRIADTLGRLVASPGALSRERLRYRHKDGSWRQLEATARNLLADPAVRGIVVNSRDVTEQRVLEEQFQQAQKLESIGRLAGGVAHDFNNLLTVILSCSQALQEDLASGTPANPAEVEEIHAAGERARDLTRQLLAFARKQVIAPVPLDLNDVVRGSQKMLGRLLGEDIALKVNFQPGAWTMNADPGQVEQVIMNLIVNARDAMPGGGTVTVETHNATISAEQAALDTDRFAGDWVRLVIRDSGVGMTPEVKAHIFEPFFTTKEQGKGTGLGLATVYGIVKQAGGHVHVESEPGRGTAVAICFPRVHRAAAPEAGRVAPSAVGGTESVLVVEDDPQVQQVTVRTLREVGYEVVGVSHPRQALELPSDALFRLRLLVTDVVMPGLDGRALAEEMCRRRPGLRVLYVSGHTQDVIAQRGLHDAAVHLLAKPFTGAALLSTVRATLDS